VIDKENAPAYLMLINPSKNNSLQQQNVELT